MTFWILTWPAGNGGIDGASPVGWGSSAPPTVADAIEQTWGPHPDMGWLEVSGRNAMRVRGPYQTPPPERQR